MTENKFNIKDRIASFGFALNGLRILIREEHNAIIHLIIASFVLCLGLLFDLSATEWILITLSTGFVICTEIINSCIENLADLITKEENQLVKKIKDLAASAVLISAITALVIGSIIFLPKIFGF